MSATIARSFETLDWYDTPLYYDLVFAEDGTLWNQLEWSRGGRRFLLRGRGSLEDLIRMARSIHGEAR